MLLITKLQAARESLEFKTRRTAAPRQQGTPLPARAQQNCSFQLLSNSACQQTLLGLAPSTQ